MKNSTKLYKLGFKFLSLASKANDLENIINGDVGKVVKRHLRKKAHKEVNKVARKATKYIK